jgi:hypothetical protein
LVKGDTALAQRSRLASIVWKSREMRSDSQLADAILKKKQTGYPLEYLLEMDGKSPSEVKRILEMARAEAAAGLLEPAPAVFNGVENAPAE